MADWNDRNSYDFNAFDAASNDPMPEAWLAADEASEQALVFPRVVATLPSFDVPSRESAAKRPRKSFVRKATGVCCYFALGVLTTVAAQRYLFNETHIATIAEVENAASKNADMDANRIANQSEAQSGDVSLFDVAETSSYGALYDVDSSLAPVEVSLPNAVQTVGETSAFSLDDARRSEPAQTGFADYRTAESSFPTWSDLAPNDNEDREVFQRNGIDARYAGLVAPSCAEESSEFANANEEPGDFVPDATNGSVDASMENANFRTNTAESVANTSFPEYNFNDAVEETVAREVRQSAPIAASAPSRFQGFQTPNVDARNDAVLAEQSAPARTDFIPTFDNPNPPTDRREFVAQNFDDAPQQATTPNASAPVQPAVPQRSLRW